MGQGKLGLWERFILQMEQVLTLITFFSTVVTWCYDCQHGKQVDSTSQAHIMNSLLQEFTKDQLIKDLSC